MWDKLSSGRSSERLDGTFGRLTLFIKATDQVQLDCNLDGT